MPPILQPHAGAIRSPLYVPVDPQLVMWGELPCGSDDPVLTVDAGAEVTVDTLSHEGILEDQGRDPREFFGRFGVRRDEVLDDAVELATSTRRPVDGPHIVVGPIAVRGAAPGDLLKVTMLELEPRVPYGVISNRHGRGALPDEYPRGDESVSVFAAVDDTVRPAVATMPRSAGGPHSVQFPIAPFLGIVGVAIPGNDRPDSIPPGPHGGNIDINLLTVGSAIYLPVQVPQALVYFGDPHFAQGDGEVGLTALEASLRATVKLEVIAAEQALSEFGRLVGPLVQTEEFLVPTGLGVDLDYAVRNCVRSAISLLQARFGMDAEHAYTYLSAATDFNISQVVDRIKGVHARIRVADFDG